MEDEVCSLWLYRAEWHKAGRGDGFGRERNFVLLLRSLRAQRKMDDQQQVIAQMVNNVSFTAL